MGVQISPWEWANFGENGRRIVKYRDTMVVCAKTAEPVETRDAVWIVASDDPRQS